MTIPVQKQVIAGVSAIVVVIFFFFSSLRKLLPFVARRNRLDNSLPLSLFRFSFILASHANSSRTQMNPN